MDRRRTTSMDFKRAKLSIIVPVFNEAPQIIENLNLLLTEVEAYFHNFEVIVVSDGSTDETAAKLLAYRHPVVKPIVIEKNSGKGNAVRAGFLRATGQYVLFIDGGMEIHPREIRIFMGLMDLYESDIVVGSKRHPQSMVIYPWYRRLLSWTFQGLIRFLFDVHVTDTQVGIKLFRSEIISSILPHLEINRYGFDLELLTLAKLAGYSRILEAPIRLDYFRPNDRSVPTDLYHVLKVGISLIGDTLKLYFRLRKVGTIPRPESEKIRKAG
jgi:glycosyltransferase involved in cell wall biosynthesis